MGGELSLTDVAAGYGRQAVLARVSATFPAAAVTCVLGPNGAGKTTLLRVLAGYLPLRAGRITLGGDDLAHFTPRARARLIAAVPQVAQADVPLTVRELVALARYPHLNGRLRRSRGDREAVEEALAALGLNRLASRPCAALSGGEWRRALIAQGLAQQTPVLLLDEPTAFLDPPARYAVLEQLERLAMERGLTVGVVLHDPALARRHAGHAVLLRDGETLASGPPARVLGDESLSALYGGPTGWLHPEEMNR